MQIDKQADLPQKTIIILGMHRSGTSCLTGSLQEAGLDLGEHSTWNPHNQKGNRENGAIMVLNEAILEASGGSWNHPPARVNWLAEHRRRAAEIIAGNADKPAWGFKDPRTLITFEGWSELLPDAQLIGIFRNPRAVAESLLNRSQAIADQAHAYRLWNTYNRRLLQLHRQYRFPILDFDWDEETFHRKLNRVHRTLDLAELGETDRFYEPGLIHNQGPVQGLPLPVRWTLSRLRKASKLIDRL